MQHHRVGRSACAAVLILLTGAASACTGDDAPTTAVSVNPSPSGVVLKTIAHRAVGEHLTLTAGLDRVLGEGAFVVRDVDLPDQGLLVLGTLPGQTRPPALVTVSGIIDVYQPAEPRDDLTAFLGRKIIIAQSVRSWA